MPEQPDQTVLDVIKDALTIFNVVRQDVITRLRAPTPIKIVQNLVTDEHGCLGMGLDTPNPETIWECPMSHEAWLHRITVTSAQHPPINPQTGGEAYLLGSMGEIVSWLPHGGVFCPVQLLEGHRSSPHLAPGEQLQVVADQLPTGMHVRFDLQIVLETGVSEFTPKWASPSDMRKQLIFNT